VRTDDTGQDFAGNLDLLRVGTATAFLKCNLMVHPVFQAYVYL
jgi:hypothetical protein